MVLGCLRRPAYGFGELRQAFGLAVAVEFYEPQQVEDIGRIGKGLMQLAIKALGFRESSLRMSLDGVVECRLRVGELHGLLGIYFWRKVSETAVGP
jgi:hypothetical protein